MKVKYIGAYKGKLPWLQGKIFEPREVYEVSDEVAKKLLTTAQFEEVKEKPPKKPVIPEKEVN